MINSLICPWDGRECDFECHSQQSCASLLAAPDDEKHPKFNKNHLPVLVPMVAEPDIIKSFETYVKGLKTNNGKSSEPSNDC